MTVINLKMQKDGDKIPLVIPNNRNCNFITFIISPDYNNKVIDIVFKSKKNEVVKECKLLSGHKNIFRTNIFQNDIIYTVKIDNLEILTEEILFYENNTVLIGFSKILNENSWNNIFFVAGLDLSQRLWKIGDVKKGYLNGVYGKKLVNFPVQYYIADFISGYNKSGITFGINFVGKEKSANNVLENTVCNLYGVKSSNLHLFSTESPKGSGKNDTYLDSDIYKSFQNLRSCLDTDLKKAIEKVPSASHSRDVEYAGYTKITVHSNKGYIEGINSKRSLGQSDYELFFIPSFSDLVSPFDYTHNLSTMFYSKNKNIKNFNPFNARKGRYLEIFREIANKKISLNIMNGYKTTERLHFWVRNETEMAYGVGCDGSSYNSSLVYEVGCEPVTNINGFLIFFDFYNWYTFAAEDPIYDIQELYN